MRDGEDSRIAELVADDLLQLRVERVVERRG